MQYINRNIKYLPHLTIALGVAAIGWWLTANPVKDFAPSVPGRDAGNGAATAVEEVIVIGEHFERFATANPIATESWPAFRGEHRDNIYRNSVPLINSFQEGGTNILWSVSLGEGHGGAAIYDGLVYVLDYDEEVRADMLRCFDLKTGQEKWRRWYDILIRRNHGMSRTVPAVTEDFIVTIGPRGHVMCVDRLTGDYLWSIDLEKEYASETPLWYTGQCPLIIDDVAIIAPGGRAIMIGVDCATGEILWETPNPHGWKMSHASIMPYTLNGVNMLVYSAVGGALGVAADGPNAGAVLWEVPEWNHNVVAASAVGLPDGKVFLTAGYGAGSMVIRLTPNGDRFDTEILQTFKPGEGLSSEQQTPIFANGHLFGILPKDARSLRNQFVCVHPSDFTKFVWTSGPTARFGLGPFILADGKFYHLNDDGTLFIIRLSTEGYVQLDSHRLIENGHDAWAPLAIANGYMVLRDSRLMVCIDLKR